MAEPKDEARGYTVPRVFTPPLRELTPQTTRGYELCAFAEQVLGVKLFPWQQWLAHHALELNTDGTYRYRRLLVMVGRQNGKTTFASVLAAWWLFLDSLREPGRTPDEFMVLGVAQNLDIAELPYRAVRDWCDPNPPTLEEKARTLPMLVEHTLKVRRANGQQMIETSHGASYEVRDAAHSRGKSAARVLMDEVREQTRWTAWNAVSQSPKSFVNGQLWGITNAGRPDAVVLRHMLNEGQTQAKMALEHGSAYTEQRDADPTIGLFEWSAEPDCAPLDEQAILQANPSIGYSGLTVATCKSDYRTMPEADYRTEVLCQFVDAKVLPYIDPKEYRECIAAEGSFSVRRGERTVWAVDVSEDRAYTSVAGAVMCDDGIPLVALVRAPTLGMLWLPDELEAMAREAGQYEVMLQERGCPAMEFRQPLTDKGLQVRAVPGSWFGIATGQFRDAIRDRRVRFIEQKPVDLAIQSAVTRKYGETDAWSRRDSAADIAPVVACSLALYGLVNPVDVPLSAYEGRGLTILK